MQEYKINYQIDAPTVLLIGSDGTKLGVMSFKQAMTKAYDEDLDLVCINSNAKPVVCKIMNFSKYQYDMKKKEKENKAKQRQSRQIEKELQFRPQIADHDLQVKLKKAKEELADNNIIRVVISFKGRELSHPEFGFDLLTKIKDILKDVADIRKDGKLEGRQIECIFAPKK